MTAEDIARFIGIPLGVAILGLAIAAGTHRALRGRLDSDTTRFVDGLAAGALAFVVFLLAFTVADGRERIAAARSVVTEEAAVILRVRRQADPAAQRALEGYVRSVVSDEWESMGGVSPDRSPKTDAALSALIGACSAVQGSSLSEDLIQLESLRLQRLRLKREGSPGAFWVVIGFLLVTACALLGASVSSRVRQLALALYLAAFGLVIALVLELERPFGGVVRVTPASIADAIGPSPQ